MKYTRKLKREKIYILITSKEEYLKLLPELNKVFHNWEEDTYSLKSKKYKYIDMWEDALYENSELEDWEIVNISEFLKTTMEYEIY